MNKKINISRAKTPHAQHSKGQRGNAMIYVLIALALFGFLTMTLSGQNDQASEESLDDEQIEFYALELIEYAAAAQQAVDMMIYSGSDIDDLDFVTPNEATFNTPPHHNKIYHPQAGGLAYQAMIGNKAIYGNTSDPEEGTYMGRFNNIEWTTSSDDDVTLTFYVIQKSICSAINEKITGSSAIPQLTSDLRSKFVDESLHSASNSPLTNVVCADCEGYTSLCVENTSGNAYAFYNIIAGQ